MKRRDAHGEKDLGPQAAKTGAPVRAKPGAGDEGLRIAQEHEAARQAEAKAGKTKNGTKPKAERTAKPKTQSPCGCGCGAATFGSFAPGHDARLWGVAHRVRSGRLSVEEGAKAIRAFPPATVKAHRDRLNRLADAAIA